MLGDSYNHKSTPMAYQCQLAKYFSNFDMIALFLPCQSVLGHCLLPFTLCLAGSFGFMVLVFVRIALSFQRTDDALVSNGYIVSND